MIIQVDKDTQKTLIKRRENKVINHINSDMIIMIKQEDLRKFGWSNDGLVTVRFSADYCL